MLNKLIRYYNQNKFEIIVVAIFCAFILIVIQIANYMVTHENKGYTNTIDKINEVEESKTESIIGEKSKDTDMIKKYSDCVQSFLQNCKNNDLEKAYSMISDDCKEMIFNNSIEQFKNDYFNKRFNNSKICQMQNWKDNIFKVSFEEDALATGTAYGSNIVDYVGVESDDTNEFKVNIGSYLGSDKIGEDTEKDNITINVIKRYKFVDYEKYEIQIKNNTGSDIQIDDLKNTSTIYLTDSNNVTHTSVFENLTKSQMYLKNGATTDILIKFINPYVTDRSIRKVTFENIIKQNNEIVKIEANV